MPKNYVFLEVYFVIALVSENELDKEWVELIKKALEQGISVDEIRDFLVNNWARGVYIMDFYEKLPVDFLIRFYNEVRKNIEKRILTKNMYYELGIITSVANRRGIMLELPADFEEVVNEEVLKDLLQSKQVEGKPNSA